MDLLIGHAEIKEVVKLREDLRIWALPAGSKTQNPADLLGSERMKSLIAGLRASFDLILIDTPPVGPVIDAVVASHLADKTVFVVKWGATAREFVQQAIQQLHGHKKVAGIVFNQVNESRARKYGKNAYSYSYGSTLTGSITNSRRRN